MTDTMPPEGDSHDRIEPVDIQQEMQNSYIDYAMSVIVGRALPEVRDGLKPVHRRVLYAMYDSGFRPDRSHAKSARSVAETMGNYHPHGDASIYDTLVRMAQPWSLRYPLVDGQGNFGSRDGDGAAATAPAAQPPASMQSVDAALDAALSERLGVAAKFQGAHERQIGAWTFVCGRPVQASGAPMDYATTTLRDQAADRGLSLDFSAEGDLRPLAGDPARIRQVLMNLIHNSIKYGKEGGVTKVSFYDMETFVLVEISDNGIGIDPEHLDHLFDRFYRADKSRSRDAGGTGLGLSIVHTIVTQHGGTISIRSGLEGKGSGFTLRFPFYPSI